MLFLDGVHVTGAYTLCFRRVQPPTAAELDGLIGNISARVGRYLERQGLLVQDMENSYLAREADDDAALDALLSNSITYRIAVGPQQGRKAFTLQILPARTDECDARQVANAAGFSLHAGVATEADERQKLERLCRYIARPAVSTARLSLTNQGHIRYALKTPYRDGTTHVIFEPLDFIARLAALVPKPRVNLTRFHGVFAPNSHLRVQVTPGQRGRRTGEGAGMTAAARHSAMSWGQRLKRVFKLDIETCRHCGGAVKVAALAHPCARGIRASMHIIACIEDPVVIQQILAHLERRAQQPLAKAPTARAPPRNTAPGRTD